MIRMAGCPHPAVADAAVGTHKAPSDEGAVTRQRDWGRESFFSGFSPSVFAFGESTSLVRGRHAAAALFGIAKAFCGHPTATGFLYSKKRPRA